jgi:hypothetical protein
LKIVDTQPTPAETQAASAEKLDKLLTEAKVSGKPVELGFLGMDGSTPMHLAALRGFHIKAAVLLKHGEFLAALGFVLFGCGFLWVFLGFLMVRFRYMGRQDLKAGCLRYGVLLVCSFLFAWQHGIPPGIQVGLNSMLAKLVNIHIHTLVTALQQLLLWLCLRPVLSQTPPNPPLSLSVTTAHAETLLKKYDVNQAVQHHPSSTMEPKQYNVV